MKFIYLDHNASTSPYLEVVESMRESLVRDFGNPSSLHWAGQESKRSFDLARTSIAELLDCRTDELVFTSGATEANNAVLWGVVRKAMLTGVQAHDIHIVTSSIEHKSVLNPCKALQELGVQVTFVNANSQGVVPVAELLNACTKNTVLISLMFANNDTGVLQPIAELCEKARAKGILVHSDIVQGVGKIPVYPKKMGLDFASFSAHKFAGPKGVGAMFMRNGLEIPALILGGKQELARRSGTENLSGIVGMGVAANVAKAKLAEFASTVAVLRDQLQNSIKENFAEVSFFGAESKRVPNTLHVRFHGIEGLALVLNLDLEGIAVSVGSACGAGDQDPSHVLLGMGFDEKIALEGVRFSLGHTTTESDIEFVLSALKRIVPRLKG